MLLPDKTIWFYQVDTAFGVVFLIKMKDFNQEIVLLNIGKEKVSGFASQIRRLFKIKMLPQPL